MNKYKIMVLLGAVLLAASQWLVYVYAPTEKYMGLAQKIFYFHLPVAWWCFASFFVACGAGITYLKTRKPKYDNLCAAAVEVGMLLATLALFTGSIWARNSWGVWWTWDPRLTTTLILWFIYAAYLILRTMPMPEEKRASMGSVIAIVGFLDVPLVFFSARIWRSIHPAVFVSEGGGLDSAMAHAAIAMVLSFGFIWIGLLRLRFGQLNMAHRLDSLTINTMYQTYQSEEKG